MAEENKQQYKSHENESTTEVDVQDRGVFDFLGKKKEQEKPHQQEVSVTEFDNKVKISDEPDTKLQGAHEPEKKQTLLDKLHRSNSTYSSSSDEEKEGEDGEKKKKKEKVGYGDQKDEKRQEDTADAESEEKKGFLDKIKEKLPGQNKKAEEVPPTSSSSDYDAPHTHETHEGEINDKEKKGLLDKIKEKLPGHHTEPNEDKEKEINATSN